MINRLLKRKAGVAAPSQGPVRVAVLGSGTFELRGSSLFSEPSGAACRRFLERLFTSEAVRYVEIRPREACVAVHFDHRVQALQPVLNQVAGALTVNEGRDDAAPSIEHLFLRREGVDAIRVHRHGDVLTTWQVLHEMPGRVRLRHDALVRREKMARYVEDELQSTFGVLSVKARPLTGTVVITFTAALRTSQLLRIVEGILLDAHSASPRGYLHPAGKTALTSASLVLAAVADFAVPGLLPASGLLLVLSNLGNFHAAWRELRRLRLGVAMLYATITTVTVVSGLFFTAALMAWFMNYWDRQYHRRLTEAQRQLLADFHRRARYVWISRGDVELELPIEQVRRGQVVSLRTGDLVPVDGYVIKGQARVDERLVQGVSGLTSKSKGDRVYASSLVFDGNLKIKVTRVGRRTRAASIGKMIEKASTPPPALLKVRGEPFAKYTVLPTLATASAGFLVGDLGTALAILRPDYATGPGMTSPLGTLEDLHAAAAAGVIVRDPTVFERVRDIDLLLFDLPDVGSTFFSAAGGNGNGKHHHGLGLGLFGRRSGRRRRPFQTGVLAGAAHKDLGALASRIGADFYHAGLQDGDRVELLRHYQQSGKRVAYVGDCQKHAQAAKHAHVAVSLADVVRSDVDPADAFLVASDLRRVNMLWEISQSRSGRHRAHYSWTMLPNLLCVAGALTLGFTSMYTVLITNIGVLTVYRSGTRWLRRGECGGFRDRLSPTGVYNGKTVAEVENEHVQAVRSQ